MNELKIEEKKNRDTTTRRIGLEIRYCISVIILYVCLFFILNLIPCFIRLFLPINPYIQLLIYFVLFVITYVLTSFIARSKGFIRLIIGRRHSF